MLKDNIPSLYPKEYDLHNCDKEPIKLIRRLQSYASLLVIDAEYHNWHFVTEDLLPYVKDEGIQGFIEEDLTVLKKLEFDQTFEVNTSLGKRRLIKHQQDGLIYFELEALTPENFNLDEYQNSILRLTEDKSLPGFFNAVLQEVRVITGYDHIMIYQFDEKYHGEVIGELKTEERSSFLGLRFPSTDIPEQARALYFQEIIRTIANVENEQVPIYKNADSDYDKDLSLINIHSRGVSPIHLEYLSNMDVKASFSVAIIKENKLWGLIACHHTAPKVINYRTRKWLKFLSKFISMNLDKMESGQIQNNLLQKQYHKDKILSKIINSPDIAKTLLKHSNELLQIMDAKGILVKAGDSIQYTKNLSDIDHQRLFDWLAEKGSFDILHTSSSKYLLADQIFHEKLVGLMILQLSQISQDYIIFTRPEEVSEVTWAGNPNESKSFDKVKGRLTPRKSFERWKGVIKDQSKPWKSDEIEIAKTIKNEIRELVYKKYNELILVNKELKEAYQNMESFSYTVSHDLMSPLRSIDGFAKILAEDYAHKFDDYGLKLIGMILENISRMKEFIQDILNYSKFNSNKLEVSEVDLNELISEVWSHLGNEKDGANYQILQEIPLVYGDRRLLKQVFQNLMTNSIKYVHPETRPEIEVSYIQREGYVEVHFSDNGIGIPRGKEKAVFEVFKRMVSDDVYKGTGVGLAIVKKIIDRHGGEIKVDKKYKKGAKFVLTLPSNENFAEIMKNRRKK
ncbi:ATP-binding protein [Portibacter marinus]|uniref:ATP-binding protein n=1 Tax=Portibacter marinus TaxID=2898660 RepID=UPI001F15AD17|nr:ATP-binding protein [Portibacter marinus]